LQDLNDDLDPDDVPGPTKQNHITPPPPVEHTDRTEPGQPHFVAPIGTVAETAAPKPADGKINIRIGGLGGKKKKPAAGRPLPNGTHHGPPYPLETQQSSEELSYSSVREDLINHPGPLPLCPTRGSSSVAKRLSCR